MTKKTEYEKYIDLLHESVQIGDEIERLIAEANEIKSKLRIAYEKAVEERSDESTKN